MAGGRPTAYRGEYAQQAEKLCRLGATDADLADFFKVNVCTIWRWAGRHDEFCNALKVGKDVADDRVERSLYLRAMGYTFDSEKIFQHQGEIIRADTREHVPPDTTAVIFWLKNRRRDQWTDTRREEVSGPDGKPIEVNATDEIARRIARLSERSSESGSPEGAD